MFVATSITHRQRGQTVTAVPATVCGVVGTASHPVSGRCVVRIVYAVRQLVVELT